MERVNKFQIARSMVEVSGLPSEQLEDTFMVSFARAVYIQCQTQQGRSVEPYKGRNPAVVNITAGSILMVLNREFR